MAELTFKSAGVSTREIDLSGPTPQTPQGTPAGVIGTAVSGPAFVPLTFGSMVDFSTLFGGTDGKKFGPLAVNEWMRSAKSCTFIRVLGIGDGKKRATDSGVVKNAGFVVGEKIVQSDGRLGDNPHANSFSGVRANLVLKFTGATVPGNNETLIIAHGTTNKTITFKTAINFSASSTGFTGNTADIGLGGTPTTAQLAAKIAEIVGGETGLSASVTDATAGEEQITIIADVAVAATHNVIRKSGSTAAAVSEVSVASGADPIISPSGRTYFLGTFMSESNGSTIFSDAGIQGTSPTAGSAATATIFIEDSGGIAQSDKFTLIDSNGVSTEYTINGGILPSNGGGSGGSATVGFDGVGGGIAGKIDAAAAMVFAINGTTDANYTAVSDGVDTVTITQGTVGVVGNRTNSDSIGSTKVSNFTGGLDDNHAVPILRGVLLAPSGVILHLSGNNMEDPNAPVNSESANTATGIEFGRKGGITGSVDLSSQEFVMVMNGFKGSASKPTTITASFDMTALNYFPNVFNTNPLEIEEKGHFLYGHFDVRPEMAVMTGSGVITPGSEAGNKLDIGFLLTGSQGKGLSTTAEHADYEDFQDRFTHAESPFVISQGFDSPSGYDLFKFVALDSGESGAGRFKISIENLQPLGDTQYGRFDVIIRRFSDTDEERRVLESHRGLTLDPGAETYIGRSIGDQHVFFNFDNDAESQKIIVDGVHPSRSRYVRVELSDLVKKKEVPKSALPFGFRGPSHLNTSGSLLSEANSEMFGGTDVVQRVVEPPFPMRKRVSVGIDLNKVINGRLYWGMKSAQTIDPADPNKTAAYNNSLNTYGKHFPKHRVGVTPFAIGNNPGVADLTGGTVLDCDRFNNNRFSLEKVKVVTASAYDGNADPTKWIDAEYVRDGNIVADSTTNTRKFRVDDLRVVSNRKFAKFTLPMQGGFDGTNIFNREKYEITNNAVKREMDDSSQGELSGPSVSAFRKAIDIMGSKTDSDIQLLAIPGIRHPSVTDFAISAVENRFDAMYIMDIEERDAFNTVITSSDQKPHVLYTVNHLKNRALDTSFAAAYFPDVTIEDPATGDETSVPPSVAVLGAYSQNDSIGHPWTAPAGFTRGSLRAVKATDVLLNRTNLDDLYDADINPITAFPGTGITVWGQKTLLESASALDRVNVRRLLINIRRKVRNIANSLLFEPNRTETLEKFASLVNPVLQKVQDQAGVDRYKVIIDTTTTTQADIENNTIRGKIFLQPTRTVEFVALDFKITNAGAADMFS